MRAQRAPRIVTAAAVLLLAFACRGAQQVASTLEVGYSTGEGSLDGTYGRSSFDSENQAVWLSLHPLAFLEPPMRTLADPDLIAALGRLQPPPAAVGSITVTTQTEQRSGAHRPSQEPESETPKGADAFGIDLGGFKINVWGLGGLLGVLAALGIGGTVAAKKIKRRRRARTGKR